jgi:hypothetical protein
VHMGGAWQQHVAYGACLAFSKYKHAFHGGHPVAADGGHAAVSAAGTTSNAFIRAPRPATIVVETLYAPAALSGLPPPPSRKQARVTSVDSGAPIMVVDACVRYCTPLRSPSTIAPAILTHKP